MASYKFDPASGDARLFWRFGERQMTKVIRCATEREAQRACSAIEETLQDIARGRLAIPDGADAKAFILSGGRAASRPGLSSSGRPWTLDALFEAYRVAPPPNLEPSTRRMQEIHFRRLAESAPVRTLGGFGLAAAQAYVAARSAKTYTRGGEERPIQRDTIAKELKTLRQVWAWVSAQTPGLIGPPWTLREVSFPKGRPTRRFMSWGEVEREVARGGLDAREVAELWDCLWLDRDQVRGLLEFFRAADAPPFLYPMVATAAFTGARRSELCRSRLADWRLDDAKGSLRQKKRDKDVEFSFRDVPVHPELKEALGRWFAVHPGRADRLRQPRRLHRHLGRRDAPLQGGRREVEVGGGPGVARPPPQLREQPGLGRGRPEADRRLDGPLDLDPAPLPAPPAQGPEGRDRAPLGRAVLPHVPRGVDREEALDPDAVDLLGGDPPAVMPAGLPSPQLVGVALAEPAPLPHRVRGTAERRRGALDAVARRPGRRRRAGHDLRHQLHQVGDLALEGVDVFRRRGAHRSRSSSHDADRR
jgi:integrase